MEMTYTVYGWTVNRFMLGLSYPCRFGNYGGQERMLISCSIYSLYSGQYLDYVTALSTYNVRLKGSFLSDLLN